MAANYSIVNNLQRASGGKKAAPSRWIYRLQLKQQISDKMTTEIRTKSLEALARFECCARVSLKPFNPLYCLGAVSRRETNNCAHQHRARLKRELTLSLCEKWLRKSIAFDYKVLLSFVLI